MASQLNYKDIIASIKQRQEIEKRTEEELIAKSEVYIDKAIEQALKGANTLPFTYLHPYKLSERQIEAWNRLKKKLQQRFGEDKCIMDLVERASKKGKEYDDDEDGNGEIGTYGEFTLTE